MHYWYKSERLRRGHRVGLGSGLRLLLGRAGLVLVVVWASCLSAFATAEDTLHIQSSWTEFYLDENYCSILEDPSGQLTLADVRSPAVERRFTTLHGSEQPPNIQHTHSAYWLRITVRHGRTENSTWYLELYDSHIGRAVFYRPALGAGTAYESVTTGATLPFATLPRFPKAGQPVTFYAMVKNMGTAPVAASSKLSISFTVDKAAVGSLQGLAQPLLPGQARLVAATSNNWKPAAAGSFTLGAVVDESQSISEWMGTNNTFSQPVKVY